LIWIRSLAIVLLIVAHALRHVQLEPEQPVPTTVPGPQPSPLVPMPELVDALRAALAQVSVSEEPETPQALPSPLGEQQINTAQEAPAMCDHEQEANNYERVKAYLAGHPEAKVRDVAKALMVSVSTANKWMNRVKGGRLQS